MTSEVEATGPSPDLEPTIGFICPLYRELAAVRAIFDEHFDPRQIYIDGDLESEYYYGRVGPRTAVAVSFADKKVGPSWAAAHATKLLDRHKSLTSDKSSCFLVGVAAGISRKEDVRLGDVVIATQVVDWTSGKVNSGQTFESTEHAEDVSNAVRLRTAKFCDNLSRLGERIRIQVAKMQPENAEDQGLWECPGPDQDILFAPDVKHVEEAQDCRGCEKRIQKRQPRKDTLPKVHRGLIAAGNVVLKDAETRERIREDLKDNALAVEMEAHGVMTASKRFVIIRGICDYGDSHKNKRWQHYAAAVAAACARLWIEDIVLESDSKQQQPSASQERRWSGRSTLEPIERSYRHSRISNKKGIRNPGRDYFFHSSSSFGTPYSENGSDNNDNSDIADQSVEEPETSISSHPLDRIPDHTEQVLGPTKDWITMLEIGVSEIELHVRDGPVGTEPISTKYEHLRLVFEIQDDQHISSVNRRLRLTSSKDGKVMIRLLWIPHTQIQVSHGGNKISLDFSNCNQCKKFKHGRFTTKNGTALYRTTYDPVHPNVGLDLETVDDADATKLRDLLLSRDQRFLGSTRSSQKEFAQCRIVCNYNTESSQWMNTIYVWATHADHEILDYGSFSDKLDFYISSNDDNVKIYMGYMDKFIYEPVDSNAYPFSSTPPTKVKENHDGGPASISYGGGNSRLSHLRMKVNSDEVCKLFSETIGCRVSWEMKAFALEVDVVLVRSSRMRKNEKFGLMQLSAWEHERTIRLLARAPRGEKHTEHPLWIACTVACTAKLSIDTDTDATLNHDIFQQGHYIVSDTFLPKSDEVDSSSDTKESPSKWNAMRLKFKTTSDLTQFERLFRRSIAEAIQ